MTSPLSIAASGLRHADLRQQATAHNTANRATSETTVLRAEGRERPGQGVQTQTTGRSERRTQLGAAPPPQGTSQVVDDAVEQIATVHQAGSLANVVRTSDEMTGILLDVVG
jgi:flagellar basal body rod protein FlgC